MIKSDNNLHLVILGSNGLADEFSTKLKVTMNDYSFYISLNEISINDKYKFLGTMW